MAVSPPHWTSWWTGWISRRAMRLMARPLLPISSTSVRSLRMTSGLFNTGGAGDSAEITSNITAVQQAYPIAKVEGLEFSVENLDSDLDMNLFEDLQAFGDPLGDASMDSFTDLTTLLGENTFLDQEEGTTPNFLKESEAECKVGKKSLKRTFAEVEVEPEISLLPTTVIKKSPSHDHDYVIKQPRMSTPNEELSVEEVAEEEEESMFPFPSFSPAPSTSQTTEMPSEDKCRSRREKNNIASKRSREIRKMKFANMDTEVERLEVENARLELRIVELEKLAKQMKEILVAKMAGKA